MKQHTNQRGAVSLFVVIFAALLMTIVTVSFIQLMLKDQQQATTSDLSQSAYDSALAGVEDAKRLLLLDQSCRNGSAASTINCTQITAALTPGPGESETDCDTLAAAGIVGETDGETIIQQTAGDASEQLDQAYTCVKIALNTDDYKGKLEIGESDIVPLEGVGQFDTIVLSWFVQGDTGTDDVAIGFPSTGPDVSLPQVGEAWQASYPALMRTQFMQTGGTFSLGDFDDSQPGNRSNANTLFLYPSAVGLTTKDFALDARRSPANAPQQVQCNESFVDGEYACSVTLNLPVPIDGNVAARNAFLRLSALYNAASYKVELKNGASDVQFDRVQPIVDSTGRTNDVFRRVQSRVELTSDFVYPHAEIDIEGDLCKNFTITNEDSGYNNSATCTP
jgi:Tfp pilus assembly protein PilX